MTALIAGVAGGFLAVIIAIVAVFCFVRKIQKNSTPSHSPPNSRPTSQQEQTEMTVVSWDSDHALFFLQGRTGRAKVTQCDQDIHESIKNTHSTRSVVYFLPIISQVWYNDTVNQIKVTQFTGLPWEYTSLSTEGSQVHFGFFFFPSKTFFS